MSNSVYRIPTPQNEPIQDYRPGSPEKEAVLAAIKELKSQEIDVPMVIGGQELVTVDKRRMAAPHDINHTLGYYNYGDEQHVKLAIDEALKAKPAWEAMPWQDRAAIFLKAADLISGPRRAYMSATTMLAQSKTVYQAEIDAVAEFADFLRFNVQYLSLIHI